MADQAQTKMIAQPVVDAMLDEIKSSMQATIDNLTQRNVNYRAAIKQLEMHGTGLETKVAELTAEVAELRSRALVDDPLEDEVISAGRAASETIEISRLDHVQ